MIHLFGIYVVCVFSILNRRSIVEDVMKFGMQTGDFMLSTNILLSGSVYYKVAFLVKFMNMCMVVPCVAKHKEIP